MGKEIEKASGLMISGFIVLTSFLFIPDWNVVGISVGCGIMQRLGYSLFHASVLHAVINAWCLLSVIFLYEVRIWQLIVAYFIAVCAPAFTMSTTPTVGLSAICFALYGMILFHVERKVYYNVCMAAYILVGFIFTQVNGWLHLYSYVAGLLVGLLTMPIPCKK